MKINNKKEPLRLFFIYRKIVLNPLFTVPDAKSDVLEKNHSRKIWINGTGYLQVLYEKYNMKFPKYISGGSVATAAFWIAEILEVEKIILVGQDLSYDGEMTHAGKIKQNIC